MSTLGFLRDIHNFIFREGRQKNTIGKKTRFKPSGLPTGGIIWEAGEQSRPQKGAKADFAREALNGDFTAPTRKMAEVKTDENYHKFSSIHYIWYHNLTKVLKS